MTGRRLYDALTDGWSDVPNWVRNEGKWLTAVPPAWKFLTPSGRQAMNAAARALTPRKRAS